MHRKRIICIGSGLAAWHLALHLTSNIDIWMLSNGGISQTNSHLAKGGIAVPYNEQDIQNHISDTLKAGDGLCEKEAVEDIISEAPNLFADLQHIGIAFSQECTLEGGHSKSRIRHIGDETGRFLLQAIHQRVLCKHQIRHMPASVVLSLSVNKGVCIGVSTWNQLTNTLEQITADAVVICSGGCGNLYQHHTNALTANGEGYAIASDAGAHLLNMEFMQFHPTKLFDPMNNLHYLITEAFRGAGAVITDSNNHEIMQGIHPMESLAPRDIVSRTMFKTMIQQQVPHLHLNFSNVNKVSFQKTFPALYDTCELIGVMNSKKIPVTPAAHYQCGGVVTDTNGQTTLVNLYAAGEVAYTGLHGANRLASNSLIELLVMSRRIANQLNKQETKIDKKHHFKKLPEIKPMGDISYITYGIQRIMWEHFGILRSKTLMVEGLKRLNQLEKKINTQLHEGIEQQTKNRFTTARLIAEQAILRKESKGCHYLENSLEDDILTTINRVEDEVSV